jgi:hypothetical protein
MVERVAANMSGSMLGSPDDEEIKTALQVAIYGREKIEDNTFYIIRTWLIY